MDAGGALCRTCLSRKWPVVNLDEAVPHLEQLTFRDILHFCLNGHKNNGDCSVARRPAHICLRCSKALQVSYHFLKLLRNTENVLMQEQLSSSPMDSADENTQEISQVREDHTYQGSQVIWPADSTIIEEDMENYEESCDENIEPDQLKASRGERERRILQEGESMRSEFSSSPEFSSSVENRSHDAENINLRRNENEEKPILSTSSLIGSNIIIGTDVLLSQNAAPFHKFINNGANFSHRNDYVYDNMEEEGQQSSIDDELDREIEKKTTSRIVDDMSTQNSNNNGIKPLRCKFCNFVSCYFESMRKHYKKLHEEDVTDEFINAPMNPDNIPKYHEITYKCSKCYRNSHDQRVIEQHLVNDHCISHDTQSHILTRHNCPDCSRKFNDRRGMRVHFRTAHVRKRKREKLKTQFKCANCDKAFALHFGLRSHLRYCERKRETNCNLCSEKFSSIRQFEEHLSNVHTIEMIHECEVCEKTFKNYIALSVHRKRHTERYFQCELCPKNYINQCELKVHMERIHNKEAKEKCRICGEAFTCVQNLRSHEIKEHFKKLHSCDYCEYQSTSVSSMRLHRYVHTGMPYRCDHCPKKFALRGFMRQHAYDAHGIKLTDDELGDMFRKYVGYPSRYDAFSKEKYSLDIPEVDEDDIEKELSEFGLKFQDIVQDLFKEVEDDSVSSLY